MIMTEGEIRQNYKLAKNPNDQIKILAEVNGVSVERIEEIIGAEHIATGEKKVYRNIAVSEPVFREVNEFCRERKISKSTFGDEAAKREMQRIMRKEKGLEEEGFGSIKKRLEAQMDALNAQIHEAEERYKKTCEAYKILCELEGETA